MENIGSAETKQAQATAPKQKGRRPFTPEEKAETDRLAAKWGNRNEWPWYMQLKQYQRLEEMLEAEKEPYKVGGLDAETEAVLIRICRYQYMADRYFAMGDPTNGKRMLDSVDGIKKSNLMRKADGKPTEALRIDKLILAMENAGLARDGNILPYDELLKVLQNDRPHYPHSHDAADQMLLCMYNAIMRNEGKETSSVLIKELQFEPMEGEFEEEETPQERRAREQLGLGALVKE